MLNDENACWNYRVMYDCTDVEPRFGIHEVYYNADGTARLWSQIAPVPSAEDQVVLCCMMAKMFKALDRPVLDFETGEPCLGMRPTNINPPQDKG